MKISLSHDQSQEFTAKNTKGSIIPVGCSDKNSMFTPMELLLVALASCSSVDVVEIFEKKKLNISNYSVDVQASRVDKTPAIFETIDIMFNIEGKIEESALSHIIDLCLNKYCSVADILIPTATINCFVTLNGTDINFGNK